MSCYYAVDSAAIDGDTVGETDMIVIGCRWGEEWAGLCEI